MDDAFQMTNTIISMYNISAYISSVYVGPMHSYWSTLRLKRTFELGLLHANGCWQLTSVWLTTNSWTNSKAYLSNGTSNYRAVDLPISFFAEYADTMYSRLYTETVETDYDA